MASMGEVQVRVQVEHPLVCLNQHPEHQWEDSGMCLSKPYREELKDGAGRVRSVHRGMVKGPAVEVCSRPGCGLIRIRQEKRVQEKKPDLGWDNAFGKIEDEEMTEPGEASFSGKAGPTKGDVLDILDEIKTTYKECERCNLLTPVSELSRDAQGRMVCKHH